MKVKIFVVMLLVMVACNSTKPQLGRCNKFKIVSIVPSTENEYKVKLFMKGNDADFINYPYIHTILNQKGDTVARGKMNYYCQFAGSTLDYPVTARKDGYTAEDFFILYFNYDTLECELSYKK